MISRYSREARRNWTEFQRRHFSMMEMESRAMMFTGHPKGRIAVDLALAWSYRRRAQNAIGGREFWAGLSRSAVSRAREDRMKTQPAEARMLALANALPEATARSVAAFREAVSPGVPMVSDREAV